MPDVLAEATKEKAATGKETTHWTRMAERGLQFRDWMPGTVAAVNAHPRYIDCRRVTKRPIFQFFPPRRPRPPRYRRPRRLRHAQGRPTASPSSSL